MPFIIEESSGGGGGGAAASSTGAGFRGPAHFAYPFAFNAKGQSVTVEQDSEADLIARAANVAVCPEGFRDELPEYGIPPLLFRTVPLPIAEVQTAIARWAEVDLSVSEHAEGLETAVRKVLAEVGGPS